MSEIQELRKFEFFGVMQDIAKKDKGNKALNTPHTKITFLTRTITNEEMDALCYGGCYGMRIKMTIECVKDPKPLIKEPEQLTKRRLRIS